MLSLIIHPHDRDFCSIFGFLINFCSIFIIDRISPFSVFGDIIEIYQNAHMFSEWFDEVFLN